MAEIKTRLSNKPVVLAVLLFLAVPVLWAQTAGYFTEFRFMQRLVWSGDENTLRYEVIVEREREKGEDYEEALRINTSDLYTDVSLAPGRYRFCVIPYNFLDRPGDSSEWMYIVVRPSLKPEFDEVSPPLFYLGSKEEILLDVYGRYFEPVAEIELHSPGKEPVVPVQIIIVEEGSHIRLLFEKNQLSPGMYEVSITNPGNMEAKGGQIVFHPGMPPPPPRPKPERITDTYLSAAWMPVLSAYGERSQNMGPEFSRYGAGIRLGRVSFRQKPLNFGAEAALSWYSFDAMYPEQENADSVLLPEINLLMQKWLFRQMTALNFRLGVGLFYEPTQNDLYLYPNTGVSFVFRPFKNFFMETGVDYTHVFMKYPSGCLRPWVGLGLRF